MYLNIMKTIMTIVTQKIDIPHPMYETMESAVDSDGESCHGITQMVLWLYLTLLHYYTVYS